MCRNEKETDKHTDELPTEPLISVEVSEETAREAARLADEEELAIEDALARLTTFDYPTDVVSEVGSADHACNGP